MAKLNDITVKHELRLCKVRDELGYFHCWEQWANVVDASPMVGGHPGGQVSYVMGIIEFDNGVRRVDPTLIKFCDEINDGLTMMAKQSVEDEIQKFIEEHDLEVIQMTSIEMNEVFFKVRKEGCLIEYGFKIPYNETRNESTFRNKVLSELQNAVKELERGKTDV